MELILTQEALLIGAGKFSNTKVTRFLLSLVPTSVLEVITAMFSIAEVSGIHNLNQIS